ncbi:MAG: molybdate ABC transporter permease subunit [Rhodothalassiaceae bacterium]
MDWQALALSFRLGAWTLVVLLPLGIGIGHLLAVRTFRGKSLVEALIALPLILPPTVLGYYLLVAFGRAAPLGALWQSLFGHPLAFSFEGLLFASLLFNLPFAIQPIQRGFEAIAPDIREAAACCGLRPSAVLLRVDLPLAWPSVLTAMVLSFAHTLGEFGVVLMVGGNIPGETRTVAIAIYDRVQAFDHAGAGAMSAFLLALSFATILLSLALGRRLLPSRPS